MHRLLAIPGDGIGHEVIPAALQVLHATGVPVAVGTADAGWDCFQRTGTALPAETLARARTCDAILFGAVASPSHAVPGYRSPIVQLRRELDLYANIRPTRSWAPARPAVDLVIVRENTEGLYAGRERREGDTAIAERVITRGASERIVRRACELARARAATRSDARPPHVTVVHKANVLRETCGLFRTVAFEVAAGFPGVLVDELLVDTAAMRVAAEPWRFDVIVTTNLFGDILSDIACIHGGGLGLATSANLGAPHALFEPVHGAAPDIAGRGVANPLAAIGCVAMLLEHLGERTAAGRVRAAIDAVLAHGPYPPDMGGNARTEDVTAAVLREVAGAGR